MKISLRWIFDHLKADWKNYTIDKLVEQFNATTAEIEGFEKVTFNDTNFSLVKVVKIGNDSITAECKEWKKNFELPLRTDAQQNLFYLIKKDGTWASMLDLQTDKEGLLPAFYCTEEDLTGGWKKTIEKEDYILEVDNKSVTNRPDLWGHRGFAREFSAMLGVALLPESKFLAAIPLKKVESEFTATKDQPFSIVNSAPKVCKRFAGLYISEVERRDSMLPMALRLLRVDTRAIDFLVDATNYTMLDRGQPLHAFDADYITSKKIEPRMAKEGETLVLLDGTEITLTNKDLVITDGKKPLALAGIKGGRATGVNPCTKSLFVEAANFDATSVRLSAARHKTRTDASARFEKTLDPNENVKGIQAFVKVLENAGVVCKYAPKIISVGAEKKLVVIKLSHNFIVQRIGTELKKGFVKKSLESLGMSVQETKTGYSVTVPTFRSTKDVTLKEDIVEEVARLFGYKNIPLELPIFPSQSVLQDHVSRKFLIKQFLAFDAGMREVENYAVADNDFLKKINWKIENGITLANPLSEQRETMIDSLVPHLLSNVETNMANHDSLRFFEAGPVWKIRKGIVREDKKLAGVFYDKKTIDFYASKQALVKLFAALDLDVTWQKVSSALQWASKYQTADLILNNKKIGQCGVVSNKIMTRFGQGEAVAFEIDLDALCIKKNEPKKFAHLSKYQATKLDISMMLPLSVTVANITEVINSADKRIVDVQLRDIFQKADWTDKKSVTMRFVVNDKTQTLSKEALDSVYELVTKAVTKQGGEIR